MGPIALLNRSRRRIQPSRNLSRSAPISRFQRRMFSQQMVSQQMVSQLKRARCRSGPVLIGSSFACRLLIQRHRQRGSRKLCGARESVSRWKRLRKFLRES